MGRYLSFFTFAKFKGFDSNITSGDFRQESSFDVPFQSFGINYRYKFGKVDFRERQSKIKNTDQKAGDGDGGGQGQGGGMMNNG